MDAATIKEARRLLHDLIFRGEVELSTGLKLSPKVEVLVPLIEKIASKKLEEPHESPSVTGFTPQGTHHVKEPTDANPASGLEVPEAKA